MNTIKNIVNKICDNLSDLNEEDMFTAIFQDAVLNIEKLSNKAREKMTIISTALYIVRLNFFSIKDSLADFSKINFDKYPVLNGGEKNSYVKKLKNLVTIYNSMLNCFEVEDIKKIFSILCNLVVHEMEQKCLTVTTKIDQEGPARQ